MIAVPLDPFRPVRQDGEQSRERLLQAARALFAEQGFSKTSTREIAEAAQANVAAISYYFGDKAGLYRAVFFEPRGDVDEALSAYTNPTLTLEQALRGFYGRFLDPLQQGETARQCMKLKMREMLEPTGLWQEEIAHDIQPRHAALVGVLCRHLGLRRADDDVHRLAVSIAGLGVHVHVGREVTDALAPRLNAGAKAMDLWMDRLVMYAQAMVAAEARLRTGRAAAPGGRPAQAGRWCWLSNLCPSAAKKSAREPATSLKNASKHP